MRPTQKTVDRLRRDANTLADFVNDQRAFFTEMVGPEAMGDIVKIFELPKHEQADALKAYFDQNMPKLTRT